jgi:hypothetical protein
MRAQTMMVLLWAAGCDRENPRPQRVPGGGPPGDSGGSGAPPDTALPGDSGDADTGGAAGPVLALRGPAPGGGGATLAVLPMVFGEGPAFGAPLITAPLGADGAVALALPAAPAGPHGALGRAFPGLRGSLYGLRLGAGDGADGTAILAFPLDRTLLWVEDRGESPWPAGWSLVDLGLSGPHQPGRCLLDTTEPLAWREGYPHAQPWADGVALTWRGPPTPLPVALPAPDDAAATALRGVPFVWEGEGPAEDLFSLPAGAASLTLTDAPPAGSRVGGDPSWVAHLYQPRAEDAAGAVVGIGCVDGAPVALRWTAPVTDWRGWRLLECYGGTVGWRAVTPNETGAWTNFLDAASLARLRVGACAAGAAGAAPR